MYAGPARVSRKHLWWCKKLLLKLFCQLYLMMLSMAGRTEVHAGMDHKVLVHGQRVGAHSKQGTCVHNKHWCTHPSASLPLSLSLINTQTHRCWLFPGKLQRVLCILLVRKIISQLLKPQLQIAQCIVGFYINTHPHTHTQMRSHGCNRACPAGFRPRHEAGEGLAARC